MSEQALTHRIADKGTFLTSSADSEWGFIPLPTRSHTSIVESEDSASEIPEHSAYTYLGMEPTEIGRTAKQIASDDYVPRVTWTHVQGYKNCTRTELSA